MPVLLPPEIPGFADAELFMAATEGHANSTPYLPFQAERKPELQELILSLQDAGCLPKVSFSRIFTILESEPLQPGISGDLQHWHMDFETKPGEELYTVASALTLQWAAGEYDGIINPLATTESLIERGLTVASAARLAVIRVHPELLHRRSPNPTSEPVPRNHAVFKVNKY